jgi:hypothetical protein
MAVSRMVEWVGWYFIQLLTLCPITIFDKNDPILNWSSAADGGSA